MNSIITDNESLTDIVNTHNDTPNSGINPYAHIVIDPTVSRPTRALMKSISTDSSSKKTGKKSVPSTSPLRSSATEDQYLVRIKSLYRISSKLRTTDVQFPIDPSPIDVVNDLVDSVTPVNGKKALRSYATWSLYRSSLLWDLASKRHINTSYETAYQLLSRARYPAIKKQTTLSKKVTFAENDFKLLIDTLVAMEKKRSTWCSKTAYWLQAGVAAGARGGEWMHAQWQDRDQFLLLIPNSKRKVGPPAYDRDTTLTDLEQQPDPTGINATTDGIPPNSNLEITGFDDSDDFEDDDLEDDFDPSDDKDVSHRVVKIDPNDAIYIDLHLDSIHAHKLKQNDKNHCSEEEAFKKYYDMVRKTLRQACELAFKGQKYYRLYNTRSQFAANKKVFHELGAVAAMMGHTNTRTSMRYGSRSDGRKGLESFSNKDNLAQPNISNNIFSADDHFSENSDASTANISEEGAQ